MQPCTCLKLAQDPEAWQRCRLTLLHLFNNVPSCTCLRMWSMPALLQAQSLPHHMGLPSH